MRSYDEAHEMHKFKVVEGTKVLAFIPRVIFAGRWFCLFGAGIGADLALLVVQGI